MPKKKNSSEEELKALPVYEVIAGRPSWASLIRLSTEAVAHLAISAVNRAILDGGGRSTSMTHKLFNDIRLYLHSELPTVVVKDVLDVCIARDRFRCHHNPTECMALELWFIFFCRKFSDMAVSHHAFAFPKTSNYPDIVSNLGFLMEQLKTSSPLTDGISAPFDCNQNNNRPLHQGSKDDVAANNNLVDLNTTITSFKLELKECDVACFLQDKINNGVARLASNGFLRVLEIPGLGSDELLHVISKNCTKLEVLNVRGSREQISDAGFCRYVNESKPSARQTLRQLDLSNCMVTQQILPFLRKFNKLQDLRISTSVLDDVTYGCTNELSFDDSMEAKSDKCNGTEFCLAQVERVSVERENSVHVSVNTVMAAMRQVFPSARNIALTNCIACELHVTLTQQPTNITYMREHIHTLDLVSADYFHFPRLVYPCPNLESLHIEKPTMDIFNVDAEDIPFLYGNTVPFVNLKHLRLSRISLTNLSHFLSKSSNLKYFKVTNIGRRERPRWTDERVRQILDPKSVPLLQEFHVSCLTNEGFSTAEVHRCLHLTKATVAFLAENFIHLNRIAGIESWSRDCTREALNSLLNSDRLSGKFSIISL